MKTRSLLLCVFLLGRGLSVFAAEAALSSSAGNRISALVRKEMEQRKIPGIAVAVIRAGKPEWIGTFGVADLENNVPIRENTQFRFASVSKPITAVAVMQLVQAGQLQLDAPVDSLLARDLGAPSHVTVRQLLSHQSGLRHYQTDPQRDRLEHFTQLATAFRAHTNDSLMFKPGTRFNYTTYGYLLLGLVIEQTSGSLYTEHMQRKIFSPSQMLTSRADNLYELTPHRAQGYFLSINGELRNSAPADVSDKLPGGGLSGTIRDLATFVAAVQNYSLLSKETTQTMWTCQILSDGSATPYGLGWYVSETNGSREIFHGGTQPRVSSMIYLRPDDATGIAILSNLEKVNYEPLARQIVESLSQ